MMEVLESVDKLMNAMDEKYYARLLANLALIVHKTSIDELPYAVNVLAEGIENTEVTEQEQAIMQYFLKNKNIRPGVLASCYSRVISSQFKVHYSV
jgi:hypothetical protein